MTELPLEKGHVVILISETVKKVGAVEGITPRYHKIKKDPSTGTALLTTVKSTVFPATKDSHKATNYKHEYPEDPPRVTTENWTVPSKNNTFSTRTST